MRKRLFILMLACMCMVSAVACNKTTKTETKTENKQETNIENMSEDEYIDYLVDETIRAEIMERTPDVVKNITTTITEDDFVTLDGVVTTKDGETESFSTECRKVSDLSVAEEIQKELLKHKVGDTFESTLPTDDGNLPVKITIKTVTDDPMNYFTDGWVATNSGSDSITKTAIYKNYVEAMVKNALEEKKDAESKDTTNQENNTESDSTASENK